MIFWTILFFLSFAILPTHSTHDDPSKVLTSNLQRCLSPSEVDTHTHGDIIDYFPHKVSATHSQYWNITYHDTYKVVSNYAEGKKYLLYQCGTVPPSSLVQEPYDLVVSVPLQRGLAITSTTQIPQLEQLGLRHEIQVNYGAAFITSPCINTLLDEHMIQSLNDTTIGPYLTGKNPDLVILRDYPDLNNHEDTLATHRNFYISERRESTNKAIYEWHKVYAALFNLEDLANHQFNKSAFQFDCAVDNAAYIAQHKYAKEHEENDGHNHDNDNHQD